LSIIVPSSDCHDCVCVAIQCATFGRVRLGLIHLAMTFNVRPYSHDEHLAPFHYEFGRNCRCFYGMTINVSPARFFGGSGEHPSKSPNGAERRPSSPHSDKAM
jgi:hypothetical protein